MANFIINSGGRKLLNCEYMSNLYVCFILVIILFCTNMNLQ